jgi:hypothetical protein
MALSETREELADLLEQSGYTTYAYPKEQMYPPFITLVPNNPYVSRRTNGIMNVSYTLTLAVANNDNLGALENLEEMIEAVNDIIPAGIVANSFSEPSTDDFNGMTLLTSNITLDLVIT